jgi:transposase
VELFEQIRRQYEHGSGTIVGTARKFGVHRRTVRQAIECALPPERKKPDRKRTKFDLVRGFIERILRNDERAPRKQRHTAHRIFVRLQLEMPEAEVAERSVRQYVEQIRRQLGLAKREVFVPQHYEYGDEAQVDWYEATVELGGARQVLQFFYLRASASGAAFHRAYLRATQTAFLEAHELAFEHFGGGFRRLRYDNLKAAVKRVLRGSRREETTRFIAFRSHYGYEGSFCNLYSGHEKGGVEGEVGRFRRNHLVPVPQFDSLEQLNVWLVEECRRDEQRFIQGHDQLKPRWSLNEPRCCRSLLTRSIWRKSAFRWLTLKVASGSRRTFIQRLFVRIPAAGSDYCRRLSKCGLPERWQLITKEVI